MPVPRQSDGPSGIAHERNTDHLDGTRIGTSARCRSSNAEDACGRLGGSRPWELSLPSRQTY